MRPTSVLRKTPADSSDCSGRLAGWFLPWLACTLPDVTQKGPLEFADTLMDFLET